MHTPFEKSLAKKPERYCIPRNVVFMCSWLVTAIQAREK
jgi:hypothetical protein